jgi:iron complex outermembrane receptor protein
MNYTFDDAYLLTFTVRRDGSSRFSPDNRWGTFPSAAFAWKLNEMSFLKNSNTISELKLRVGYGITGQQDIGQNYAYLPRYTASLDNAQYQLGNTFYTTLRAEGYDANIKWEQTATSNAGIDFAFKKARLSGSRLLLQKYNQLIERNSSSCRYKLDKPIVDKRWFNGKPRG